MATDRYKYFRVEARELLEQMGKGVIDLEREQTPAGVVPRILRLAHTLKGAARVVKQAEIAELAHELEERLAPFREGREAVPRERIDLTLGLLDAMSARVKTLAPPPDLAAPASGDEHFRTLRADVAEMDGLLDGIAETQTGLGALRRTASSLPRAGLVAGVDELRALVMRLERELTNDLSRIESELEQVRGAAERLRLMPVSTLFSSLERAVRDAARALGKQAVFRGEGGGVRLDGHILASLQSALVQVVRNAVAHGIESEEDRLAAGKPAEGIVSVEVERRGARVAFVCRDDGKGVDLVGVQRALQRRGTPLPASSGGTAEHLLRTLLEGGGISTTSAVTETSGRGIGLDVVREVTARLGGRVTLRTQPGQGTTLDLDVPVSLASLDALVVEASGASAAIPVDAVRETIRRRRDEIARTAEGDSILYEGVLIPFLSLTEALGQEPRAGGEPMWSAVVVRGRGGRAAIGVDRLRGRTTLLVRPLPALAAVDAIVAGASLDAEGDPQPVLDPDRLVEAAQRAHRTVRAPAPAAAPILVVDDSLTTRMLEQSILESAGYVVELASSAEEALEKARHQRYRLFLVDVEMPGMDGFTLLEQLRLDPAQRDIPAFLVTSRDAPEDRARGTRAGARAYIVKSEFEQAELLARIRGLVG